MVNNKMAFRNAVSVFYRFFSRYCGICRFFSRYCGLGTPHVSLHSGHSNRKRPEEMECFSDKNNIHCGLSSSDVSLTPSTLRGLVKPTRYFRTFFSLNKSNGKCKRSGKRWYVVNVSRVPRAFMGTSRKKTRTVCKPFWN